MKGQPLRTAVLVSGSGSNLQAIIDATLAGRLGITINRVISDRPGAGALGRAARAGIPTTVVPCPAEGDRAAFQAGIRRALDELEPDLVVLAGFLRILTADTVTAYEGRMLNVHPSLLPRYPGLHTYRRALANGDRVHGSTVHFVIPALDAGPGLLQYRVLIQPEDTEDTLRHRVQRGEHLIYPRAIAWLAAGRAHYRDGAAWLDGQRLAEAVVVDETEASGGGTV